MTRGDCGICGGYGRLWWDWFCPLCLGLPAGIIVLGAAVVLTLMVLA